MKMATLTLGSFLKNQTAFQELTCIARINWSSSSPTSKMLDLPSLSEKRLSLTSPPQHAVRRLCALEAVIDHEADAAHCGPTVAHASKILEKCVGTRFFSSAFPDPFA